MVLFFDETPWLDQGSSFKENLAYYWNEYFSKANNVKIFLTGSATTWMLDEIINDKGGLHGRTTCSIYLQPFDLIENYLFIKTKIPNVSVYESFLYYMTLGGVAYYLEFLLPTTYEENVNYLFKLPHFVDEYNNIFRSLFKTTKNNRHQKIIEMLCDHRIGLTKQLINDKLKVHETTLKTTLRDLELSGFIRVNHFY